MKILFSLFPPPPLTRGMIWHVTFWGMYDILAEIHWTSRSKQAFTLNGLTFILHPCFTAEGVNVRWVSGGISLILETPDLTCSFYSGLEWRRETLSGRYLTFDLLCISGNLVSGSMSLGILIRIFFWVYLANTGFPTNSSFSKWIRLYSLTSTFSSFSRTPR